MERYMRLLEEVEREVQQVVEDLELLMRMYSRVDHTRSRRYIDRYQDMRIHLRDQEAMHEACTNYSNRYYEMIPQLIDRLRESQNAIYQLPNFGSQVMARFLAMISFLLREFLSRYRCNRRVMVEIYNVICRVSAISEAASGSASSGAASGSESSGAASGSASSGAASGSASGSASSGAASGSTHSRGTRDQHRLFERRLRPFRYMFLSSRRFHPCLYEFRPILSAISVRMEPLHVRCLEAVNCFSDIIEEINDNANRQLPPNFDSVQLSRIVSLEPRYPLFASEIVSFFARIATLPIHIISRFDVVENILREYNFYIPSNLFDPGYSSGPNHPLRMPLDVTSSEFYMEICRQIEMRTEDRLTIRGRRLLLIDHSRGIHRERRLEVSRIEQSNRVFTLLLLEMIEASGIYEPNLIPSVPELQCYIQDVECIERYLISVVQLVEQMIQSYRGHDYSDCQSYNEGYARVRAELPRLLQIYNACRRDQFRDRTVVPRIRERLITLRTEMLDFPDFIAAAVARFLSIVNFMIRRYLATMQRRRVELILYCRELRAAGIDLSWLEQQRAIPSGSASDSERDSEASNSEIDSQESDSEVSDNFLCEENIDSFLYNHRNFLMHIVSQLCIFQSGCAMRLDPYVNLRRELQRRNPSIDFQSDVRYSRISQHRSDYAEFIAFLINLLRRAVNEPATSLEGIDVEGRLNMDCRPLVEIDPHIRDPHQINVCVRRFLAYGISRLISRISEEPFVRTRATARKTMRSSSSSARAVDEPATSQPHIRDPHQINVCVHSHLASEIFRRINEISEESFVRTRATARKTMRPSSSSCARSHLASQIPRIINQISEESFRTRATARKTMRPSSSSARSEAEQPSESQTSSNQRSTSEKSDKCMLTKENRSRVTKQSTGEQSRPQTARKSLKQTNISLGKCSALELPQECKSTKKTAKEVPSPTVVSGGRNLRSRQSTSRETDQPTQSQSTTVVSGGRNLRSRKSASRGTEQPTQSRSNETTVRRTQRSVSDRSSPIMSSGSGQQKNEPKRIRRTSEKSASTSRGTDQFTQSQSTTLVSGSRNLRSRQSTSRTNQPKQSQSKEAAIKRTRRVSERSSPILSSGSGEQSNEPKRIRRTKSETSASSSGKDRHSRKSASVTTRKQTQKQSGQGTSREESSLQCLPIDTRTKAQRSETESDDSSDICEE